MKPEAKHPLPDSRERKSAPSEAVQPETNFQRLRALIAWLNMPEAATCVELGISNTTLRGVLNGTTLPDLDTQHRVYVMSRRWPHGLINQSAWPLPAPPRKRGPKEV
jgi:hypothetical protein